MNPLISLLRKIAKSSYWQTIYSFSKEGGNLKLFTNDIDLTDIQITFLKYLGFYSSLYLDVALGDIDKRIFENEIYEDSYALYRNKMDKKKEKLDTQRDKDFVPTTHWVFKNGKK